MNRLSGYKTYIVAALGICAGVYQICNGDNQAGVQTILGALGLGALRAGVKKSGPEQ